MDMFIELTTGQLINIFWLNNVYVEDTNCIFEMVNGAKYIEEYTDQNDAQDRCDDIHSQLTQ